MPDDFRISELPTSADFNNLDLMEISQVDENSLSGYTSVKKTMNQIGDKLNNSIEYSIDLNTTDKKIIGAINEVKGKSDYFESEKAIGVWIDDKVIYRRVVTGLGLSTTADTWLETNIDASGISAFIKGRLLDSSGQSFICSLGFSNSKVAINMPIARNNLSTLIFEYTKT